ncbi:MAG: hypothetical protein FWC93_07600 [Defluviitaleaceae bacterium]|nr:hypothetical protein [Defluviitaleaceae bacterium]
MIEKIRNNKTFLLSTVTLSLLLLAMLLLIGIIRAPGRYVFGESTLRVTHVDMANNRVEMRDTNGNVLVMTRSWSLDFVQAFIQGGWQTTVEYFVDEPAIKTQLQQQEEAIIDWSVNVLENYTPPQLYVLAAIFGLIFIIMGLGFVIYPEAICRWRMRRWVEGGEPTDFAEIMNQFGGVFLIILAFAVPLIIVFA